MSEEEECIHGITADWCSLCKHPRRTAASEDYGPVFMARFEGWCYGCDAPISLGESVRAIGERYGHTRCYPEAS